MTEAEGGVLLGFLTGGALVGIVRGWLLQAVAHIRHS